MLRVLRHYWRHLRHYPHFWLPTMVITPIASAISNFAVALIAAGIIDRLGKGAVPVDQLWPVFGKQIVLFLVATLVGELVLWRLVIWLAWSLEARMVERLYAECFDHLSQQSASFFADRFVGTMVSTVNKFTNAYITAVDTIIFQLLPLLSAVVIPIVVLADTVPLYSVGIGLVVVVFTVVSVVTYRPIGEAIKAETEAQTAIGGRLADVLSNVLVVKSFGREPTERSGFAEFTGAHRGRTVAVLTKHMRRDFGIGAILTSLLMITLVSILWGQATGAGVGTLVVMLTFSLTLFGWLWEIPRITRQYNKVYGDATPMVELFAVRPSVLDPTSPQRSRIGAGKIDFDAVSFGYPGGSAPVFEGLTLRIAPGERIGLVGPSGSGKTSLTRLLLRFFDPESGSIAIDGQDIRLITQHALRASIAFVPQEPLLFHRSIAENIRYGRPDATEEAVRQAAERAQVMEFARDLPDGLGTPVGERGVKLSGGQRQRIAIARAILSDAPILLLDEATSALDSLSEARIQTALDEAMRGRTTIAIAHRLSTLRSMSRLVVMDGGTVVEDGPHEELLLGGGVYATMWERQSGGFVAV